MDLERKEKIRQSLNTIHEWPSLYMFKCIVPTVSGAFEQLRRLFPEDLDILTRQSSNGKYTSVTIKVIMMSADEVFMKHEEISKIEGVISL